MGFVPVFTETYDYDIRGWLTEKSSPVFDMKLRYFDPVKPDTPQSWTGNISEWEWKQKNPSNGSGTSNTYAFTYDKFSRMTDSRRFEGNSTNYTYAFTEAAGYDRNGNIDMLYRADASGTDDVYDYTYSGNQILSIYKFPSNTTSNATYTYAYDRNGNMTRDGRNDLELKYNFLNLLSEVKHISWGDDACVEYKWSADGMKLSTDMPSHAVDNIYLGSLVYYHWDNELRLESTGFSSGRIFASDTGTGMSHTPTYFITDHLGSTRAIVQLDGEADSGEGGSGITVLERNDYYPFGMRWSAASSPLTDNRYTFSGKEDQFVFGLPYLDFGFRMYDPVIARWTTSDPLAELYTSQSPYNYCVGNPVNVIDPNGLWIDYMSKGYWDQEQQNIEFRLGFLAENGLWDLWGELMSVWNTMNEMFYDMSQGFSLQPYSGGSSLGGISYNSGNGLIMISYNSTAQFVHEIVHVGQLYSGEIMLLAKVEATLGQDIHDEVTAYRTQYIYDPNSVSGLRQNNIISDINGITPNWVQGITLSDGTQPYNQGGDNRTGIVPIGIFSSKYDLMMAYPNTDFSVFPENFVLGMYPGVIYMNSFAYDWFRMKYK